MLEKATANWTAVALMIKLAKRSGYRQTCHNHAVARSAGQLDSWGYKVWADIRGYPKPQKLCVDGDCRIPDIIAKKGRRMQVIEFETPDSVEKDWEQHRVLRTWARRNGAEFHRRVCDV